MVEKNNDGAMVLSDWIDITSDISESCLDYFFAEGIIKEIPVLKTVIALFKSGKALKDYFSNVKIRAFLTGCQELSDKKISKFNKNLENVKKQQEIGLQTLLIVDNMDRLEKAKLVGKLFVLLIEKEVDEEFYMRLCHMIDKSYYDDLLSLKLFESSKTILTSVNSKVETIVLESLFSTGFISECGIDGGNFERIEEGTIYRINDYGEALKKIL